MIRYKESILYIILIFVIFIFTISKTYPKIVEIINVEKDLHETIVQSVDLQRKLEDLKRAEIEKITLSKESKKIYKPEYLGADIESSFTVIFDDIIDVAKYNGIRIYAIQYNYNPSEDDFVKGSQGKYNVCKVDMEIVSDYQDLESFLKDIYKYPYLINIDKLEMSAYPKNKKILLTNLNLKLYSSRF